MADSRKAGKLILDNLAMFNESVELFNLQIHPEVFKEIRGCAEHWARANGWVGVFDGIASNDKCWIAPPSWKTDEAELGVHAWFGFWHKIGNSTSFNLANLCGCGQDRMGFIWGDTRYLDMTKRQWTAFCNNVPAEISLKLSEIGFERKTNGWFTGWLLR